MTRPASAHRTVSQVRAQAALTQESAASARGSVPVDAEHFDPAPLQTSGPDRSRTTGDGVGGKGDCADLVVTPVVTLPQAVAMDPELARVVDAWASLPPAIRAGILAMVKASEKGSG